MNPENFDCLTKTFRHTIDNLNISKWEHFARFKASDLVNLSGVQISDLQHVFRKLDQMGLCMRLSEKELDEYYHKRHNKSIQQLEHDELLATSVHQVFACQGRVIRALEKNHIHTLGDLLTYSIGDIVKMKGVGPNTLSVIQEVIKSENFDMINTVSKYFVLPEPGSRKQPDRDHKH